MFPLEVVETVSLRSSLVVEDDPAMRGRLGHVLATLGNATPQIAWADSIATAKELLGAQSFGIALVDIGLSDGSGVELIGWMQAQHRARGLADRSGHCAPHPRLACGAAGFAAGRAGGRCAAGRADPVGAQGLSNRDRAESLSASRLTEECHTRNIYRKPAFNSRAEAVHQARRHGLLD